MINNQDELNRIVYQTAEQMGISIDIPICFEEDETADGTLYATFEDNLMLVCHYITFDPIILTYDNDEIKKIIIHELIHYKILVKNKSVFYNLFNVLFPHGIKFIFYAIKYKTYWLRYIKTLGLSQCDIKMIKKAIKERI